MPKAAPPRVPITVTAPRVPMTMAPMRVIEPRVPVISKEENIGNIRCNGSLQVINMLYNKYKRR